MLIDESADLAAQLLDVRRAGAQDFGGGGIVEQGQQQVLDRDEFVPFLAGLDKGHVQADFEFLRDHSGTPRIFPAVPCRPAGLPERTTINEQVGDIGFLSSGRLQFSSITQASGCW